MTGRNVSAGTALLAVSLVAGLAGLGGVAAAHADGAPFTVTADGVSLPAGQSFPDGGHVNIHAEVEHSDLHFEAKCIDRDDAECEGALHDAAQFIGASFIPWSAFGITAPACVSWVQVAGIPKHFGDAGEAPICLGGTPSTSPSPTEPPASSEPPVTPMPTSSDVPPTGQPSETPSTPSSNPTTTSPAPALSPQPSGISSVSTGTSRSTPSGQSLTTSPAPAGLADTGTNIWGLGLVMLLSTALGLGAIGIGRRTS